MATVKIRHLVIKRGAQDEPPRYFWQPSAMLRRCGWAPERVPENWRELDDLAALAAAALAAAHVKNAELDAWRASRGRTVGAAADVAAGAAGPAPSAPAIAAPRTLQALIQRYREAGYPSVKRPGPVADKTRQEYKKLLVKLDAWGGDERLAAIGADAARTLYREIAAKHPATAAALMRMGQTLYKFARLDGGWGIKTLTNPFAELGVASAAPSGMLWPREAVGAFVATADRLGLWSIGTAVMLNSWLGQRQGDVIRFPRNVLEDRGLVIRQRKGGAGVALPLAAVPALVTRVEAELERQKQRGVAGTRLLVSEARNLPYREDHFRHLFAAARAALAAAAPRFAVDYLPPGQASDDPRAFTVATGDLLFMHLRHTAITRLLEAGCTPAEAATISGHSLATVNQIMSRYLVRNGTMAAAALRRRVDRESGR